MKSKKDVSGTSTFGVTKFVATIPIEKTIEFLTHLAKVHIAPIFIFDRLRHFSIYFDDKKRKIPIYVTLQSWNVSETKVTLSYNRPGRLTTVLFLAFLFALLAVVVAISYVIFDTTFAFVILWILAFMLLAYSKLSGLSHDVLDNQYQFDGEKVRIQEDLMLYIVEELKQISELDILEE